jgi:hypothetical protein
MLRDWIPGVAATLRIGEVTAAPSAAAPRSTERVRFIRFSP